MRNKPGMDQNASNSDLFLLTGGRGAGKTSLLQKLVEAAKQARWTVSGLLSPARLGNGQTGIHVTDAHSGTRRLLASRILGELNGPQIGLWTFDHEALAWGTPFSKACLRPTCLSWTSLAPWSSTASRAGPPPLISWKNPWPAGWQLSLLAPDMLRLQRYPRAETVAIQNPSEVDRLARQFSGRYLEQTQPH